MYLTTSPASSHWDSFVPRVDTTWPASQPSCRGQIWTYKSSPQIVPVMYIWVEATLLKHLPQLLQTWWWLCTRMEKYCEGIPLFFIPHLLVESTDPWRLCWQGLHSYQGHITAWRFRVSTWTPISVRFRGKSTEGQQKFSLPPDRASRRKLC